MILSFVLKGTYELFLILIPGIFPGNYSEVIQEIKTYRYIFKLKKIPITAL